MELLEAYEQVRTVLSDPSFREGLLQLMAKERAIWKSKDIQIENRRSREGDSLADLLAFDVRFIKEGGLRSFILEHAIKLLPQPAVITVDDLQELVLHHLSGIERQHQDFQYGRFVAFALLQIKELTDGPRFTLGYWHAASNHNHELPYDTYCTLSNGFDLYIGWEWDTDRNLYTNVDAWIVGSSTEPALLSISKDIERTTQIAFRLLRLSATSREGADIPEYFLKHQRDRQFDPKVEFDYDSFIPPFSYLLELQSIIAITLKCHYSQTDFATRINHAIKLARCADLHPDEAIGISFCVSALEALLCEGKEEKGIQLRERIPAILQFQGRGKEYRSINKSIIALYDIRSQAVHGSRLHATQAQFRSTMRLLSAIFRGVLEWAAQTSKDPEIPEDQEWIAELRKITSDPKNPGKLPGVTNELSEHVNLFVKSFEIDHE